MTLVGEALGMLRQNGGGLLQGMLSGDQRLPVDAFASPDDHGLFGPKSVAWRVHGDSSMLVAGARSLMIQTLHPQVMAGVDQHSTYVEDPLGRLHRTGQFIGATTFGTTETAENSLKMVRAIHKRVTGIGPEGPYEASDPHLLRWVHVTEVDSFLGAYLRYGSGKLTDAECDQYVKEMRVTGEALGAQDLPSTYGELQESLQAYRPELYASEAARRTMKFLLNPPLPLFFRPVYPVIAGAAVGLLPDWARKELRVPLPPLVEPIVVRPAAVAFTRAMGWFMSGTPRSAALEDRLLT